MKARFHLITIALVSYVREESKIWASMFIEKELSQDKILSLTRIAIVLSLSNTTCTNDQSDPVPQLMVSMVTASWWLVLNNAL